MPDNAGKTGKSTASLIAYPLSNKKGLIPILPPASKFKTLSFVTIVARIEDK